MTPLLSFDRVTCIRGGRLLFEALSFGVGPGEALHVTGPNGSGKSSLIRLAAGLLRPDSGNVQAAPHALADDNLALDRELPLGAALAFWGGDSQAGLQVFGLGALADLPMRLLSAGQAKRTALARVVASRAPLWLLDEPANALDASSRELLAEAVQKHRADGGAVVAASHLPLEGEWRVLELGR
jgi:heme exporter protein A